MNAEQKRIFDALRGDRGFVTWEEMADEVEAMIAENARLKKAVEEARVIAKMVVSTLEEKDSPFTILISKEWLKEYGKEL